MHEFVLSGAPMKRELGIRTLDLAKRLLDHGFHPPTVYFPLLVDEALLSSRRRPRRARRSTRSPRRSAEILREAPRTRRSPATRPTRRRCAGSTRRAPAKRPVIRQPPLVVGLPANV
jgi:glycine dehydrogenase subunit 2